jgi:DNA polymerase-3 subunit alpha
MAGWFPLHCHSHFSLKDAIAKPEQIAKRVAELGHAGSALTDHGSVAGVPAFLRAMKDAGLQAIPGCEFYLSPEDAAVQSRANRATSHVCVLAKGQEGWKGLVQAVSRANQHFDVHPRLSLQQLAQFARGQWIVFSGHLGSDLANCLFTSPSRAHLARSREQARSLLRPDWMAAAKTMAQRYVSLFGRDDFYVEIQLLDSKGIPASAVVAECLRELASQEGLRKVATADSHYCRKEDASDHRLVVANGLTTTLKGIERKLLSIEDGSIHAFFACNDYYIPSLEEMARLHQQEELDATLEVASRCQPVSVSRRPMLPTFPCPKGKSPDDYLKELCRQGWRRKIQGKPDIGRYTERIKEELDVLIGAKLSSYFLIVQDAIGFAHKGLGSRTGPGRGSAAGCLVSYLLGITRVDPLEYDLLFSRFYSAARNDPKTGRYALPDIDTDFTVRARDRVIDYCRDKYGPDRVCQMATFTRMQGRGALKDVLRAHEAFSFEETNQITEHIPDESEISDHLQHMVEAGEEPSIITWALQDHPDKFAQWCKLGPDGHLEGELAPLFAQAIRLEGTRKSMGRHPSGVIIASESLADVVPMVYDPSSHQQIVGVDMRDAEDMGLVKFDFLATAVLDKIETAEAIIRTGRCN